MCETFTLPGIGTSIPSFVVQLFSEEQRENYAREHLWKDADELSLEELELSQ